MIDVLVWIILSGISISWLSWVLVESKVFKIFRGKISYIQTNMAEVIKPRILFGFFNLADLFKCTTCTSFWLAIPFVFLKHSSLGYIFTYFLIITVARIMTILLRLGEER